MHAHAHAYSLATVKWLIAHAPACVSSIGRVERELADEIESINRKRKADQLAVGPQLSALEAEWVGGVKKNLEIESQCLKLEAECAALREAVEAKRRQTS